MATNKLAVWMIFSPLDFIGEVQCGWNARCGAECNGEFSSMFIMGLSLVHKST